MNWQAEHWKITNFKSLIKQHLLSELLQVLIDKTFWFIDVIQEVTLTFKTYGRQTQ